MTLAVTMAQFIPSVADNAALRPCPGPKFRLWLPAFDLRKAHACANVQPMNASRARKRIRELARAGRWEFTLHALDSLVERDASVEDVLAVLTGAETCRAAGGRRWRLSGADHLGDPLTLIVELRANVVVVTVFRGDEP